MPRSTDADQRSALVPKCRDASSHDLLDVLYGRQDRCTQLFETRPMLPWELDQIGLDPSLVVGRRFANESLPASATWHPRLLPNTAICTTTDSR